MLLVACGPTTEADGTGDTDSGTMSSSDTGTDPTTDGPVDGTDDTGPGPGTADPIALSINADVDLLFVIDNSSSMAAPQQSLAAAASALVDALDDGGINYRIGITTTDNGNPWCTGTTPEGGGLELSSCRGRIADFTDPLGSNQETACLDVCPHESLDIVPTATFEDPSPTPRPWLEVVGGESNIAGVTVAEALACALPQGVTGCGFEQPLENVYKGLQRTTSDSDPAFGFLRDNAVLGVVVFTDEADCSYNTDHETIFLPEGDRTFWSDPTAGAPTSAVCWNAGVSCDGSSCSAVDLDPLGGDTNPANAVMRPVSRYVDVLQSFEDQKKLITPSQDVVFALIGGVGSDGSVTYQSGGDPGFVQDYGIGPGCVSGETQAVPPARMREVAEAMQLGDEQAMFSICASDFGSHMQAIANQLRSQLVPACLPVCVADTDPTTQAVEVECDIVLEEPAPDGSLVQTTLTQCSGGVPAGEEHCWTPLTGDARSDFCTEEGWNLEVGFEHIEGAAFGPGARVTAACALSESVQVDCPLLP